MLQAQAKCSLAASCYWQGHETVLDVGCGLGLMVIGAAKRLMTGTGTGIWQTKDLSGSHPDAARQMRGAKVLPTA